MWSKGVGIMGVIFGGLDYFQQAQQAANASRIAEQLELERARRAEAKEPIEGGELKSEEPLALLPSPDERENETARDDRDDPIPGYLCHWFRDDPARIEAAKAAGYEHVLDASGEPTRKEIDGSGVMMRRPSEEELRNVLTLKPEATSNDMSRVWLHVNGNADTAILLEYNGHTVGWLSAKDVARVALMLSKNADQ
jgi:hypothetical protein